ncbi:hypothetical protein TrVE_jg8750 [Triparma verrucosa]|uniref:Triosephosphate isomerase n=1 Tax=Triparma verrucosa TaxID=1606542 RepID=A0A9W6ZEE1_9STRA|nr:hypothetical protein TrVE_jg8750 [Triparma verrucosa]
MKFVAFSALALATSVSAFSPTAFAPRTSTSLSARKPFIAGNWKMNPGTKDEAVALGKEIAGAFSSSTPCEVALFAPYPFLDATVDAVGSSGVKVGAEMAFTEGKGAYTAEVSVSMIKSVGCNWALAGHSERRTLFGESDEDINKQVLNLLNNDVGCILCIGETQAEYEQGLVGPICTTQLKKNLLGVTPEQMANVVIAYEPVWAIGTGLTCPASEAQDVHATCRSVLADMYGQTVSDTVRIQYGGSVTPETVDELMAKPDIDGALVGGASLVAEKFSRIINFEEAKVSA